MKRIDSGDVYKALMCRCSRSIHPHIAAVYCGPAVKLRRKAVA